MTNAWHIYIVDRGRISLIGRVQASNEYAAKLRASKDFGVETDLLAARTTPYPNDMLSPLDLEAPDAAVQRQELSAAKKAKLIDKIKKLVALSQSPNENEAARAADKAQALLAEHNLSMLDVLNDKGVADVVLDREYVTPSNPWRRRLANGLASLYFCSYYYEGEGSNNRHCFVGSEANVMVTKLMLQYLVSTVDRLARDGARDLPDGERSPYRTSFREACATRLCARIRDRIEDAKEEGLVTESGTKLPALLGLYDQAKARADEFIEQNVGKLKSRNSRPAYIHSDGVADGHKAGERISLDKQVGGTSSGGKLLPGTPS